MLLDMEASCQLRSLPGSEWRTVRPGDSFVAAPKKAIKNSSVSFPGRPLEWPGGVKGFSNLRGFPYISRWTMFN